ALIPQIRHVRRASPATSSFTSFLEPRLSIASTASAIRPSISGGASGPARSSARPAAFLAAWPVIVAYGASNDWPGGMTPIPSSTVRPEEPMCERGVLPDDVDDFEVPVVWPV